MPLFVFNKSKTKKLYLNLNNYRNWHYQTSNNIKKAYQALVYPKLPKAKYQLIEIKFTMYRGDKRKVDRANVLSIHEKFFCDALTKHGFIPDDADKFIKASHYYSGGVDRQNPRVEIEITILK